MLPRYLDIKYVILHMLPGWKLQLPTDAGWALCSSSSVILLFIDMAYVCNETSVTSRVADSVPDAVRMLLRQIGDNSKYGDHRCVSMSHYCCKLPFLGEAFPGDRTSAHKTMLQIYPWKFCPYVLNIIRNGSTVIFSPLFTQWPIYLSPHKNAHTNHHRWGWGYYNNSSG